MQDIFTISGNVKITGNRADSGGGIIAFLSNLTVTGNVEISDNQATGYGGGISFSGNNLLIDENVSIFNNHAGTGGGIGIYSSLNPTNIAIHGLLRSNSADNGGGALFFYSGGPIFDVQMTGCAFEANSAGHSGGALSVDNNQRSVWLIQ